MLVRRTADKEEETPLIGKSVPRAGTSNRRKCTLWVCLVILLCGGLAYVDVRAYMWRTSMIPDVPHTNLSKAPEEWVKEDDVNRLPFWHVEPLKEYDPNADPTLDNTLLVVNFNIPGWYNNIPLIREMFQSTFPNIVFYGPIPNNRADRNNDEPVNVCDGNMPHGGMKTWGWYACFNDALHRFPHYTGYVWTNDDVLLNVWNFKDVPGPSIWFPENALTTERPGGPGVIPREGWSVYSRRGYEHWCMLVLWLGQIALGNINVLPKHPNEDSNDGCMGPRETWTRDDCTSIYLDFLQALKVKYPQYYARLSYNQGGEYRIAKAYSDVAYLPKALVADFQNIVPLMLNASPRGCVMLEFAFVTAFDAIQDRGQDTAPVDGDGSVAARARELGWTPSPHQRKLLDIVYVWEETNRREVMDFYNVSSHGLHPTKWSNKDLVHHAREKLKEHGIDSYHNTYVPP